MGCEFLFPLDNTKVSLLDLDVGRTRLFELLPLVGVFKVPPDPCELSWDFKIAVLLGSNPNDVQLGQQVTVC